MSRVAVVILNYNGIELLKKFLPSVIQYCSQARIIVADNNSTDGSRELLAQEFPNIELIPISSNLGFCAGYNFALKQVEADYYVLLNSDVEVTDNWLTPLTQLLDNDSTIAAVQPKILSYRDKNYFEYAGAGGGFIDRLGYPFCRGRIFEALEEDKHQFDDTVPVFWATGACLVIRSKLYHAMGGLDETFFAHMEEIDLCWRLKRSGYEIMYCGKSHVFHVGGATLSKDNPKKTYYNFRNGIILLIKNLSPGQLIYIFFLRIILDWIASFQFLLKGQIRSFLAVFRAHFYILTRIIKLLDKRSKLPYKVGQVYKGSIVFDHFLNGKVRFEELEFNSPK